MKLAGKGRFGTFWPENGIPGKAGAIQTGFRGSKRHGEAGGRLLGGRVATKSWYKPTNSVIKCQTLLASVDRSLLALTIFMIT